MDRARKEDDVKVAFGVTGVGEYSERRSVFPIVVVEYETLVDARLSAASLLIISERGMSMGAIEIKQARDGSVSLSAGKAGVLFTCDKKGASNLEEFNDSLYKNGGSFLLAIGTGKSPTSFSSIFMAIIDIRDGSLLPMNRTMQFSILESN